MPRTVNVHEAKTHLSRLLAEVEAGAEIVVARNGRPCARLVPLEAHPPSRVRLGFVEGYFSEAFWDPLPDD